MHHAEKQRGTQHETMTSLIATKQILPELSLNIVRYMQLADIGFRAPPLDATV